MKSKKIRCLRLQNGASSSDTDDEFVDESGTTESTNPTAVVEAVREFQKLRKRRAGISVTALATGKQSEESNVAITSDPFKLKTGGMIDMRALSGTKPGEEDDDVEARLAKTFATETNKRDEDAEMIKYIEEELAKRKGLMQNVSTEPETGSDLLRDVPEHLRPSIGQQKEDMLSNQMLCGIPEVDLGVEAKMKNIEATEEAKQRLLKHRFNRRHGQMGDGMAPVNMAVNFVQHSRWNNYTSIISSRSEADNKRDLISMTEDSKSTNKSESNPHKHEESRRIHGERPHLHSEKATDTIVLQRFKNHMRDRRRR